MIKVEHTNDGMNCHMEGRSIEILMELAAICTELVKNHVPQDAIIRFASAGIAVGNNFNDTYERSDFTATADMSKIDPDTLKAIFGENPFKKSGDTFDQIFGDLFNE